MQNRPYLDRSITQLAHLSQEHRDSPNVLQALEYELSQRSTKASRELHIRVKRQIRNLAKHTTPSQQTLPLPSKTLESVPPPVHPPALRPSTISLYCVYCGTKNIVVDDLMVRRFVCEKCRRPFGISVATGGVTFSFPPGLVDHEQPKKNLMTMVIVLAGLLAAAITALVIQFRS